MQKIRHAEKGKKGPFVPSAESEDIDDTDWEFAPLDKSSFTPMYFQIRTQLLKMIQGDTCTRAIPCPARKTQSRVRSKPDDGAACSQSLKSQGYVVAPQRARHICQSAES